MKRTLIIFLLLTLPILAQASYLGRAYRETLSARHEKGSIARQTVEKALLDSCNKNPYTKSWEKFLDWNPSLKVTDAKISAKLKIELTKCEVLEHEGYVVSCTSRSLCAQEVNTNDSVVKIKNGMKIFDTSDLKYCYEQFKVSSLSLAAIAVRGSILPRQHGSGPSCLINYDYWEVVR